MFLLVTIFQPWSPFKSRIWSLVLNPCFCREPVSPTLGPVLCLPCLLRAQDSPSLEPSQGLCFCPSRAHGASDDGFCFGKNHRAWKLSHFTLGQAMSSGSCPAPAFRMSGIGMPHARKIQPDLNKISALWQICLSEMGIFNPPLSAASAWEVLKMDKGQ